ncbi:hypothetical protein FACS1894151_10630 [Spirochaetia bacterium]|nr:hypothetical protein FACS1894151_10630 [Spirochaetia bacterium]
MKPFIQFLLQAEGEVAGPNFITTLIPFALIIVIFYFLIIRPQNKKQKETKKMLEALKKGDKIVTIGGVHGVIQTVKENTVIVKVDEYTKMEFSRSAISTIVTEGKDDNKNSKTKEIEDKKADSGETSETSAASTAEQTQK